MIAALQLTHTAETETCSSPSYLNIKASQLLHMRRCAAPEGKIPLLDSDPGTGTLIFIHASIRWDAKQEITQLPTDKTVLSIYEKTGAEI